MRRQQRSTIFAFPCSTLHIVTILAGRDHHLLLSHNMRLTILAFTTVLNTFALFFIVRSSSEHLEPPRAGLLQSRASPGSPSSTPASPTRGPAWHEHPMWQHPALYEGANLWPSANPTSGHPDGQHRPNSPGHNAGPSPSSGKTPQSSASAEPRLSSQPQRVTSFNKLISSASKTHADKGKGSVVTQTSHVGSGHPQQAAEAGPKRNRKRPGERPPGYSGKGRPFGSKDSYQRPYRPNRKKKAKAPE